MQSSLKDLEQCYSIQIPSMYKRHAEHVCQIERRVIQNCMASFAQGSREWRSRAVILDLMNVCCNVAVALLHFAMMLIFSNDNGQNA